MNRFTQSALGIVVGLTVAGCGAIYGPCLEAGSTGLLPEGEPGDCIQVYEPVCGCDGETYSNTCFAFLAGVTVAHDGQCGVLARVLLPQR